MREQLVEKYCFLRLQQKLNPQRTRLDEAIYKLFLDDGLAMYQATELEHDAVKDRIEELDCFHREPRLVELKNCLRLFGECWTQPEQCR